MLGDLWQDLRYGARLLARNPGLTLTVVITLSVGIGANASIFSIVNAVLLRPFPYIDENRLMAIESGDRKRGEQQMGGVSPGNFWELRTAIPSRLVRANCGSTSTASTRRPCRASSAARLIADVVLPTPAF